jgi:pimeloyl-ACP methyl ester carboxylesterase
MSGTTLWEDFLGGEIRYYDAGGVRTRCLEAGSGEPLVLLHGNGGHAEIFIRNIKQLAEHFRVYVIDMLGHGFTGKPDIDYLIPDYVNHVKHFMDAAGIAKATFVGHALAGWVATYLTVFHAERVECLINLNGLTHLNEKGEDVQSGYDQIRTLSATATAAATPESIRKRLEFVIDDPAEVTDELVAVRYVIYSQPETARVMEKITQVNTPAQRQFGLTAEQLKTIRVPVLLIFGDQHPLEKLENFQRMNDLIPGSQLRVMADANLLAMWEKPDEFNRLVLEFLTNDHTTRLRRHRCE